MFIVIPFVLSANRTLPNLNYKAYRPSI